MAYTEDELFYKGPIQNCRQVVVEERYFGAQGLWDRKVQVSRIPGPGSDLAGEEIWSNQKTGIPTATQPFRI